MNNYEITQKIEQLEANISRYEPMIESIERNGNDASEAIATINAWRLEVYQLRGQLGTQETSYLQTVAYEYNRRREIGKDYLNS